MCNEYVYSSWCKTCKLCGLESVFLSLDKYNVFSAPLERGYNRAQRFRMKVDKLLCLHNGPNSTDPIWKYLDSRKLFLHTPFDVRQTIRRSTLKQKHYDALRIFTEAFTNFRVSLKNPLDLKKNYWIGLAICIIGGYFAGTHPSFRMIGFSVIFLKS